jgi:hypothetical protein
MYQTTILTKPGNSGKNCHNKSNETLPMSMLSKMVANLLVVNIRQGTFYIKNPDLTIILLKYNLWIQDHLQNGHIIYWQKNADLGTLALKMQSNLKVSIVSENQLILNKNR